MNNVPEQHFVNLQNLQYIKVYRCSECKEYMWIDEHVEEKPWWNFLKRKVIPARYVMVSNPKIKAFYADKIPSEYFENEKKIYTCAKIHMKFTGFSYTKYFDSDSDMQKYLNNLINEIRLLRMAPILKLNQ